MNGAVDRLPIIYLPVEFRSREFDSKALLATVLAVRGYSVMIGRQWSITNNLRRLRPGVMLFKSFNAIHHEAMRKARSTGQIVMVLEEELLAHMEKKAIGNFCVRGMFDLPDLILANGDFEKEALTEFSEGRAKIEVTGNGRVDLLKPQYRSFFQKDVDAIRARFGDFILVNTNFALTNTQWPSIDDVTRINVEAGFVKLDDPDSVQAWRDQIEFEQLNSAAMLKVIVELSRRRPKQKIVVRPHPGEALERWNGVFAQFPNVSVVREGAHVPWTLASKLLIHTSCTTGFEAQAAGKVALSLVAKPNWISQSFISNHLNPFFTDPMKMVLAVERYLVRNKAPAPQTMTDPNYYIWNFTDRSGVEKIADVLTRDLPPPADMVLSQEELPVPPLSESVINKFSMSAQECADVLQRLTATHTEGFDLTVAEVAESVFMVGPKVKAA